MTPRFRAAVERWDIEAISQLLAPRTSCSTAPSPSTPSSGARTVTALLGARGADVRATSATPTSCTSTAPRRWSSAPSVGDRELEGIDLLRFNEDGLIADFTVFVRPLSGLVPFAQAMGEKAPRRACRPCASDRRAGLAQLHAAPGCERPVRVVRDLPGLAVRVDEARAEPPRQGRGLAPISRRPRAPARRPRRPRPLSRRSARA